MAFYSKKIRSLRDRTDRQRSLLRLDCLGVLNGLEVTLKSFETGGMPGGTVAPVHTRLKLDPNVL